MASSLIPAVYWTKLTKLVDDSRLPVLPLLLITFPVSSESSGLSKFVSEVDSGGGGMQEQSREWASPQEQIPAADAMPRDLPVATWFSLKWVPRTFSVFIIQRIK